MCEGGSPLNEVAVLFVLRPKPQFFLFTFNHGKFKTHTTLDLSYLHLLSYSSEDWKSKMSLLGLKSRCWQGWFLLEAPVENVFLASSSF